MKSENRFLQFYRRNFRYFAGKAFASRIGLMLVAAMLVGLLTGCSFSDGVRSGFSFAQQDYSNAGIMMGTVFTATYRPSVSREGAEVWSSLISEGNRLENEMLSWRGVESEIARLNASAGSAEGFEVSTELEAYLKLCLELAKRTGGAFDVTIGALSRLWNIDEASADPDNFRIPSEEEIRAALTVCGYDKVRIENHRVYMPEGMMIDLGAIGKGIYLGSVYDTMDECTSYGVVSAGGSILTYGYKPSGENWHIGIANPTNPSSAVKMIAVSGTSYISTSGDYERYIEVDGVRYHHILDPRTGYPAENGISSVSTVIPKGETFNNKFNAVIECQDMIHAEGIVSDAITTAIFVLGEEEGLELAAEYGIGILIIRKDGIIVTNDAIMKYVDM